MTHATTVLTPRQRGVAALIAAGRTNAEIGRALGITLPTVKRHVGAILRRLRMANRAEVAAWYAVATMGEVGDAR